MQETLHDHHRKPRFADDIDFMGGSSGELQDITNRLLDRATAYGIEVSTEKSKIMTNSRSKISADISVNGQKLDQFYVSGSNSVQGRHLLSRSPHQD